MKLPFGFSQDGEIIRYIAVKRDISGQGSYGCRPGNKFIVCRKDQLISPIIDSRVFGFFGRAGPAHMGERALESRMDFSWIVAMLRMRT